MVNKLFGMDSTKFINRVNESLRCGWHRIAIPPTHKSLPIVASSAA